MGISDPRLYDPIAALLERAAPVKPANKAEVRRHAHYIRALGFSGQSKYLPVLNALRSNRYYDDYAERAILDLAHYQNWNPVISNRATFKPQLSDDANRFLNMLTSDDLLLNRLACKRIYEGTRDPALYDALEKKVRANYMRTDLRDEYEDSVAWQVKALSSSRDEKYRNLLTEVAQNSPSTAVQRHARRSLERDYQTKLSYDSLASSPRR